MDYKELNLIDGDVLTAKHMAHIEQGIKAVTNEVTQMKTAKIVLRNDGTQNWAAANPVLLKGEPAIEFDENNVAKVKIGDGITAWNDLPYLVTETINDGGNDNGNNDGNNNNNNNNTEIPAELEERITVLERTIGGFDVRIENSEKNVTAAVIASEEALTIVKELRAELEVALTKVEENNILVENIDLEMDTIRDTQESQQLEIQTTSARVDNLVAGLTNNAEFDNAELLDIRVGYDGVTHNSAGAAVRQIGNDLKELSQNIGGALGKEIVDGLAYEGNQLYLTANGEKIGNSVTITGGGGGINQTYTITLMDLLGNRVITITGEEQCILEFSYYSIDADGFNDGPGIGYISINRSEIAAISIAQGENSFNITPHLAQGKNEIEIRVENSEGAHRVLAYTVNVLVLAVASSAPEMGLYSGQVSLPFTVTGSGIKTVHFLMDGRQIETREISTSGVSQTIILPEYIDEIKLEGPHILTIYAEVSNGLIETIKSNTLKIGMLYHDPQTTTSQFILMMDYKGPEKVEQGTTLTIPYMVYDPFLQTTDINLNIYDEEGNLYKTTPLQVDRSPQPWTTQDYPSGQVKFEIVCKDAIAYQIIQVAPSVFDKEVITDGCLLDFNARGRSNNENNPEHWEYKGITASFDGFGWANVDGWYNNPDNGQTALRFLPGNSMTIHYKPFEHDLRTSGYTIEAEFETHNVRDYDSLIISSLSDGRGLSIKSQSAELVSESSAISVLFKEDSRVRVTFVVEQISLYRFVYVYINGVMSGVIQYQEGGGDDFQQDPAVEIFIGAESCGLDLYNLRMYNRGFTRNEQLNNFICDRPTLADRIEANNRNDVLDDNDIVSISYLPMQVPYLIIESELLPTFKGDDVPAGSLTYVEPLRPERNFTAQGVGLDVQGTSSEGYPVKNYKLKMKSGLKYTQSGETAAGFPIIAGGLECKNICIKADFASSEQANNVMLVDYYEMLSPYKTPAQKDNSLVRTAIRGFPCVVFWKNTINNTTTFLGTYNFNDDKSNENVFGFDREKYPNCECVEFLNNTSDRVLFNRSEYEEWGIDEDGEAIEAWRLDFEYRFPDLDDPYKDYTQFKRMTDWVVSTNRAAATNVNLERSVTMPHWNTGVSTTFTTDSADYRLSKFKAEFEEYFIKDAMIFYYLFTEIFLLMDNRAKNLFLTTFDGNHWFPIPYDMDSALGINNEGELDFEYDLEDTDQVNGKDVFTGQQSVLWHNVRDCFVSERRTMYQSLRGSKKLSYEAIKEKMLQHQSVWPEAIWNEDKYNKYIVPYIDDGENYLKMLLGDKKSQRDWWLFNGFKYRDSKYNTGDALTNFITLRTYAVGDITITPYSHICPRVQYGSVYAGGERVKRNTPVTLPCIANNLNDTETYIYSADRIASVGDLSPLHIGQINVAAATKLQELIVGSEAEGYKNSQLKTLTVGNNELLRLVNVSNCDNAEFMNLNLSGCHGLETILAEGTKLASIAFPNGGHLKTIKLPTTIANLTIQNQKNIETLTLQSQDNLTTLCIEGTPGLPIETLVNNSPKLNRVRLTGVEWNATNEASLRITIDKLIASRGLDANGINLDKAVVTGRVHITTITESFLEEINDNFPELVVVVNGVAQYFIRYADWNNNLLYRYIAVEGTAAIDPVKKGYIDAPNREDTESALYDYKGWSELPQQIYRPYSIIAQYETTYLVTFYYPNGEIGNQQWVKEFESAVDPVEKGLMTKPKKDSTDQYSYEYSGWDRDYTYIDSTNLTFYPTFTESLRSYWVYFYNDEQKIQESQVYYGDTAIFTGDTDTIYKYIGGEPSPYYEFTGWSPDPSQPITGLTYYYAEFAFNGYIEDTWEQIIQACRDGDTSKYGLGGRKRLTYTLAGVESTVEMEIVGKNHDILATKEQGYNNGAATAALTFGVKVMGAERRLMNKTPTEWNGVSTYNAGGWELTSLRAELQGEMFNALPAELQNNIKPVVKISDRGYYDPVLAETVDKLWLFSDAELNGEVLGETVLGQGTPYPVFNIYSSRIKTRGNSKAPYWTRSTGITLMHYFRYVDTNGYVSNSGAAGSSMGVAFGFCL